MAALATDLSAATGQEITIPRLNKSQASLAFADLKPKTRDIIRTRLAPEYDHLEAYFERPW